VGTRKGRPVELPRSRRWTFLTHHAQVLLAVARNPELRVREIAACCQITERYAYQVLSDLQQAGYVCRSRRGRCNHYEIHPDLALRDPIVGERSLRESLRLVAGSHRGDLLAPRGSKPRSIDRSGEDAQGFVGPAAAARNHEQVFACALEGRVVAFPHPLWANTHSIVKGFLVHTFVRKEVRGTTPSNGHMET
jgi:hypothetical protein